MVLLMEYDIYCVFLIIPIICVVFIEFILNFLSLILQDMIKDEVNWALELSFFLHF